MKTDVSLLFTLALLLIPGSIHWAATSEPSPQCQPTREDQLGPFYVPDAPVRSKVGQGYELSGRVRSAADCAGICGAKIEFWLAGPSGSYDDDHRATVFTETSGVYRFESNFPPGYSGRPPHIHVRVSAQGFRELVTQHYPKPGERGADFTLVLTPAP